MLVTRTSKFAEAERDRQSDLHDPLDPDPWLAFELDGSLTLAPCARQDLIANMRSRSRQFFLPLARVGARLAMACIQVFRIVLPRRFTSSHLLHRMIVWGLRNFGRPEANRLILRHFHLGSEVLRFVADNSGFAVETTALRPRTLDDLRDDLFVQHDVNLFNFIIRLNRALGSNPIECRRPSEIDFSAISETEPELGPMPTGAMNRIDLASAIEVYTPLYQLLLSDSEFWRASNSLQLDETVALYVSSIVGDASRLSLVNNRHPLVPESTGAAGHRLVLHGLGTEALHAWLRELKRLQRGRAE